MTDPNNARAFRQALGSFMTGVTVVTTIDQLGRKRGFTANSFTSVSLDPPLVLVCIANNADAYDAFTDCQGFAVNVLTDSQKPVSNVFATKEPDKFDHAPNFTAVTGAPVLEGCIGWFDCTRFNQVDAGDHVILIGEVKEFGVNEGYPLGYWKGGYVSLGEDIEVKNVNDSLQTHVGCILGWRGQVLLQKHEDGWRVPSAPLDMQTKGHDERIKALLAELNLQASVDFLYSVFEDAESGDNHIVYRGSLLQSPDSENLQALALNLFDHADLPWEKLNSDDLHIMLERYFRESSVDSFGVYADGLGGSVSDLSGEPRHWKD